MSDKRNPQRADGGPLRFLVYFLPPVPLGCLGMVLQGAVATGTFPSLAELVGVLGIFLCFGYLYMGFQSAVFALVMRWLEWRGVRRIVRCVLAAAMGACSGATIGVVDSGLLHRTVSFSVLGAVAGVLTVLLADALAALGSRAESSAARRPDSGDSQECGQSQVPS